MLPLYFQVAITGWREAGCLAESDFTKKVSAWNWNLSYCLKIVTDFSAMWQLLDNLDKCSCGQRKATSQALTGISFQTKLKSAPGWKLWKWRNSIGQTFLTASPRYGKIIVMPALPQLLHEFWYRFILQRRQYF